MRGAGEHLEGAPSVYMPGAHQGPSGNFPWGDDLSGGYLVLTRTLAYPRGRLK